MSYEDTRDPRLGRTVVAYPQPPGFGWLLVVLGLIGLLIGGGAMLFVVTHLDAATRHAIEELHSATWLTVAFLPGGIALLVWGVLEIVRKPEWHICEKGIVRLSRANAKSLVFWQDISAVNVVRLMQYGRVVGFHLLLDKKRVYVPSEAVANRAYELWAEARRAA